MNVYERIQLLESSLPTTCCRSTDSHLDVLKLYTGSCAHTCKWYVPSVLCECQSQMTCGLQKHVELCSWQSKSLTATTFLMMVCQRLTPLRSSPPIPKTYITIVFNSAEACILFKLCMCCFNSGMCDMGCRTRALRMKIWQKLLEKLMQKRKKNWLHTYSFRY